MPHPKDRAKQTGDTHPPELDDTDAGVASEADDDEARPGRGENAPGFLKEREAPASGGERN